MTHFHSSSKLCHCAQVCLYKHLKWIFPIRRLKDILTKITVFCHEEAARLSHFSLSCHRHLSKKKTAARLILTPGIHQCQTLSKKTLEILEKSSGWGNCWTSKGVLAGKMSYCSAFNLLIAIHCLQHGARRLHRLSGGGISKIVF